MKYFTSDGGLQKQAFKTQGFTDGIINSLFTEIILAKQKALPADGNMAGYRNHLGQTQGFTYERIIGGLQKQSWPNTKFYIRKNKC